MMNTKEIKKQIETIKAHSINEYRETIHLFRLLKKRAKSKEEKAFIQHQSVDILKISVVVSVGALPGGTIVVAFIEMVFRKFNKTILPTSFSDELKSRLNDDAKAKPLKD